MQPQEQNVARRSLDVEDYIDILRRHRSWIIGPAFAAIVVSTVGAFLWPDTFVSYGTVRVVPPKIPETYVPSNLNSDLVTRFNSMMQGILAKDRLQAIVNNFGLYKKDLKRMPMEDVVEAMRQHDIKIEPVQSVGQVTGKAALPAFRIGFQYQDRRVAQAVAQKLISDLMSENYKETGDVTARTTEFLNAQRDEAKKKLDALEGKLSEFRQRNLGHLPEQQQSNFNQLATLQTSILNVNTSMSRVNQDKLVIQQNLNDFKTQLARLKDPSTQDQQAAIPQKSEKLAEKDREIATYESMLAQYRERYSENHPDVQTLVGKVAAAKRQREEIVKEEANKKPEAVVAKRVNPEVEKNQRDLEIVIGQLEARLKAKDLEMQDYQKQLNQLNGSVSSLQARLQGLPVGLKEYDELMHETDLARKEYESAEKKATDSKIATNVIKENQGEQLEQIEIAPVPETPIEPKRPMIILAGGGVGLLLGLFMAGLREVKDSSLKNLKDVRAYTQLPILGSIPLLENDLIVRRRKRMAWLAWATACLVGVIVMSSSVVYYYATRT